MHAVRNLDAVFPVCRSGGEGGTLPGHHNPLTLRQLTSYLKSPQESRYETPVDTKEDL